MFLRRIVIVVALLSLVALTAWVYLFNQPKPDARLACHYGAYRSDTGGVFAVTPTSGRQNLRIAAMNGETWVLDPIAPAANEPPSAFSASRGWTGVKIDGVTVTFGACEEGTVAVEGRLSIAGVARRETFDVTDTTFTSGGLTLAGRLIMPRVEGAVSVAVLVHGSERHSAILLHRLQHLLPANNIGVFVYDKRGTGKSQGRYTQDFHLLAGDAAAALVKARELAGPLAREVGFEGGSQGGWIAPLAATKTKADFVLVGYGLAESPLAEDREEVFEDLRRAGYGDDVIAKAREITDATGRVMASDFETGFDDLDAVRAKYGKEPWFAKIKGEFTGDFLNYPNWVISLLGPWFDVGTTWDYDPLPALRAYQGPHLWILAGRDSSAPSDNTLRILRELQPAHPNLDIVVFPTADHGITEFEDKDGKRVGTRFSEGYFQLLADWINFKDPKLRVEGPIVHDGDADPASVAP
jgi:pimeloyl-ACP methyl ester carboxylesterase